MTIYFHNLLNYFSNIYNYLYSQNVYYSKRGKKGMNGLLGFKKLK